MPIISTPNHRRSRSLDIPKTLNFDAFQKPKAFDDSTSEKQRRYDKCIDWPLAARLIPQHSICTKSYLAVLKHIQRIPKNLFECKFVEGVQDLQKLQDLQRVKEGNRPLLAISEMQSQSEPQATYIDYEKSSDWLIKKVQILAPDLLTGTLFSPPLKVSSVGDRNFSYGMHEKRIFHDKCYYAHQTIDLVFIDDASYSGLQMKHMIENCLDLLENNDTKVGNVYILLTAMSSVAKKEVQEKGFIILGKPIHMPSYRELINGHSKLVSREDAAALEEHFRLNLDSIDKQLSYFWHKVPDHTSIYLPNIETSSEPQGRFYPSFYLLIGKINPPYKYSRNPHIKAMENIFLSQLQTSDHQLALKYAERFVSLNQIYIDLWFDDKDRLPRDQLGNLLVKPKAGRIRYKNSWYKRSLEICIQKKHTSTLIFLIRNDACANENFEELYDFFKQALMKNRLEVVRELIQYAQPNLRKKVKNSLGEIYCDLCEYSKKYGSKNFIEVLNYLFLETDFWTPQEQSDSMYMLLICVIELNAGDALEELFFHSILISQPNRQAWVFKLAKRTVDNNKLDILKLLFKNPDIFDRPALVDWIFSLLKESIKWDYLDFVKFLFSELGVITTETKQQWLPNLMDLANCCRSKESLNFLKESVAAPYPLFNKVKILRA